MAYTPSPACCPPPSRLRRDRWHALCLAAVLSVNPNLDPNTALAYTFLAHLQNKWGQ